MGMDQTVSVIYLRDLEQIIYSLGSDVSAVAEK